MTTAQLAESIATFPLIAGSIAIEVDAQAESALADLEVLTAGITELRQRMTLGMLDAAARSEIADDLVALSDRVLTFALAVAA
jgi:hypothetical protein